MTADPRWIVEGPGDLFYDVGAADLDISGGCLIFRDANGKITVAYAAGTWLQVSEGAE